MTNATYTNNTEVTKKFQELETAIRDQIEKYSKELKNMLAPTNAAPARSSTMSEVFTYQRIPVEEVLRSVSYPGLTAKGISALLYREHGIDITPEDVQKRVSDLRLIYGVDVQKTSLDVDGRDRTFYYIES